MDIFVKFFVWEGGTVSRRDVRPRNASSWTAKEPGGNPARSNH